MVVDHVVVADGSVKLSIRARLEEDPDIRDIQKIGRPLDDMDGTRRPNYHFIEAGLK